MLLKLLYRNRVDEAAERAMSLGLVRLATLIPMAGEDPARDYVREQVRASTTRAIASTSLLTRPRGCVQVEAWESDRSTAYMDAEVLLVYRLLSGVDSEALHQEVSGPRLMKKEREGGASHQTGLTLGLAAPVHMDMLLTPVACRRRRGTRAWGCTCGTSIWTPRPMSSSQARPTTSCFRASRPSTPASPASPCPGTSRTGPSSTSCPKVRTHRHAIKAEPVFLFFMLD